jgi:carbonic anhydrase
VFHAFANPEENVRRQIEKLRSHPWVPKQIAIRGFVYNEKTGKLAEVRATRPAASAG